MPDPSPQEVLKDALPCPCGYCDGAVHLAEASKARRQMILGYVITCQQGELRAKPHHEVSVVIARWNALVRDFEKREDAELNAIADARAGGPFVEVDINRI